MKNKLPVYIDNLELPQDNLKQIENNNNNNRSYGFVSVIFLLSTMITLGSLLAILIFKK